MEQVYPKVAYVSTRALDGSLMYRCYTVFVPLIEEPPEPDEDEPDW